MKPVVRVREEMTRRRRLAGFLTAISTLAIILVPGIYMIQYDPFGFVEKGLDDIVAGVWLSLLVGVPILTSLVVLLSRPKIELTPLLVIDETKPIGQRVKQGIAWFFSTFVIWILYSLIVTSGRFNLTYAWIILFILSPFPSFLLTKRSNFFLCKEGVVIRHNLLRELHRWDSFRSFTTDERRNQFKLEKSRGFILLSSAQHFDDVKGILSEYISFQEQ